MMGLIHPDDVELCAPNESHFKITVVSDVFEGVEITHRHPMVEDVVTDEMLGDGKVGVLMLQVMAKTNKEWEEWKKKIVKEGSAFFYPPG